MKNLFLLLLLIFVLFIPWFAFAQTPDCSFGFVNDPAPGSCGSYIDTDSNNLCDLSEVPLTSDVNIDTKKDIAYLSEAELKEKTVKEVAEVYGIETSAYRTALSEFLKKDVKGGDSLLDLHDIDGLCSGVAANIALGIKNNQDPSQLPEHDLISGEEVKALKVYEVAELYSIDENEFANSLADYLGVKVKLSDVIEVLHDNYGLEASVVKEMANAQADNDGEIAITKTVSNKIIPRYRFLPITIILLFCYLITYILVLQKKMKTLTMRRIWNVVLLLSFLASAVLGLLLIIRINWGFILPLPFNMIYWHVEAATVMLVVTLFHLSWHWRFYTCMLRRKSGEECKK